VAAARRASDLIRIRPRPRTAHISRGRSVLATTVEGLIEGDPDHGFFVHETRLLSRWRYRIDGAAPIANAFSSIRQNRWLGYYVIPAPGVTPPPADEGSGQVPPESRNTLELRVQRFLEDALEEEIELTNYAMESTSFVFTIEVDADFADQAETRKRRQHGELRKLWEPPRLVFEYSARNGSQSLRRGVEIDVGSSARYEDGQLSFDVRLQPKENWRMGIRIAPLAGGRPARRSTGVSPVDEGDGSGPPAETASIDLHPLTADVMATIAQAGDDLAALRLDPPAWTLAAGVPLYVALFGRDTLTSAWQAGILGPEMMSDTLRALAATQGTVEDDWRDEQPGKMLHEAHTGPLSILEFNPRARSYSSITTSGLYAFIVAELWHWTGDRDLVRPYIEPALRGLQWLKRYGDLDGDGFYEYRPRSPMGPVHQAWKDSPDAIVGEDGALIEPPIATCEEQAFVYAAKLHLAETLWFFGEHDLSRTLFRETVELKKRFNEAFWMEDEGFFALGLDGDGRQIRSIASNAGHCLAAAIADHSLVEKTADRLFQPDLFSGWGIRTLSCDHPRYNPYSYHLGSIWPVEHGTFALGFWRYGLYDRVEQIARAQFEAAALFEHHRLPELFGGHPRDDEHPFPAIYPNANPLQAWSSSSVFALLQAILGLYPHAPLHLLVVDPHLPEWLPEITLRDLRVGKARVTIRFHRQEDGRSSYRILDQRGTLHVVRQATPWSLTAQPGARIRDALASLLPGH
jgi:glycogen debranching enzyme